MIKTIKKLTVGIISLFISLPSIFASQTDSLPWSQPMNLFAESMSGPIVRGIAIAAIVVAGCMMAFGEFGAATRRMLMIVLGFGVALAATSWLTALFNFSGALIK
ncbi:MAG: TrbC/VirB2 family protein [Lentisphaerota bacterium]